MTLSARMYFIVFKSKRFFLRKVKLTPEQIDHARKLIDKGDARQYGADLLNVGRSLYRALNV
jgi:hypothetical protein